MPIKLTLYTTAGPLEPFDTIEMPSFSIIVGPNGVGKSLLLQAIKNNSMMIDAQENNPTPQLLSTPTSGVVLITNHDPLPQASNANIQIINTIPGPSFSGIDQHKLSATSNIIDSLITDIGITKEQFILLSSDPWALGAEEIIKRLGFTERSIEADRIHLAFEQADTKLIEPFMIPSVGNIMHRYTPNTEDIALSELRSIAARTGLRPTQISQQNVDDSKSIGSFGIFDPDINRIISFYRDKYTKNKIDELNGIKPLDQSSFEKIYGRPPWELIDEVLAAFGMPYTVVKPRYGSPAPQYQLTFRRSGVLETISPYEISSGEKVLLRFALAMLSHDPLRTSLTKPTVLLLDEVDASLHPQMLNRWMESLTEEFVQKRGVSCILTTHSPITVALAPEGSIFVMTEDDRVPRPISKQQALNRLTVGLPTLSVEYSGQRQVFVESDTDAAIFNSISTMLKKQFNLQRSLAFISTGFRNKNNVEQNAGCSVVKAVTTELRKHGNRSVFGLIDWDGNRTSNDVVKVIAENTHYTLENIILDPLLVGALLLRDSKIDNIQGIYFTALAERDPRTQQVVADYIQEQISYPDGSAVDFQTVEYIDAPKINVRRAFALSPGHDIEASLALKFPFLGRYTSNRGAMVKEIVSRVLPQYPHLCPLPIYESFRVISEQDN